jgi:hypothetical protein
MRNTDGKTCIWNNEKIGGIMAQEKKIETTVFPQAGITGPAPVPVETIDEQIKRIQLENAVLEQQNLKEELEAKAAERERRGLDIRKLKGELEKESLAVKQLQYDRESAGKAFAQADATDLYRWSICTHKKGGTASPRDLRVLTTGGNGNQYAIIKHQMINGDIWVRCLRCAKTWKPPVEREFYFRNGKVVAMQDGKFDKEKFDAARFEYINACNFGTNNSMSGSVQCRFSTFSVESGKMVDAADVYRDRVSSSNLR